MPGGARGSSSKRSAPTRHAQQTKQAHGSRAIAPIYNRLPHGPHALEREEVVRHQRARIQGGMIEAVARGGYERASVKQVIGLAGVSRRSFYEQFPNKQACFLATFDLLATRGIRGMAEAHLATEGDFAERLHAGFGALCAKIEAAPKAASLVLVEAQTAGVAGSLRVHRSLTGCERLLARAFASSPDAACPSAPIIRAITGGLHGTLAHSVLAGDLDERGAPLAERLTTWTTAFATGSAESEELLSTRLRARMRAISLASAHRRGEEGTSHGEARTRILHEALRLVAMHDHRELSAPQIADEAGVPIDAFLELFATREECYLAALDMVGERLLAALGDAERCGTEWPVAVRRATAGLLSCLGESPVYARTIAQTALAAGSAPAARARELLEAIATRLLAGAPAGPGAGLAPQVIAGALLHTIRAQVLGGRIQLLGALSEHLAYVVLVPVLGADAAHEALSLPLPPSPGPTTSSSGAYAPGVR
jgi:AcrR family transcriptional regulator